MHARPRERVRVRDVMVDRGVVGGLGGDLAILQEALSEVERGSAEDRMAGGGELPEAALSNSERSERRCQKCDVQQVARTVRGAKVTCRTFVWDLLFPAGLMCSPLGAVDPVLQVGRGGTSYVGGTGCVVLYLHPGFAIVQLPKLSPYCELLVPKPRLASPCRSSYLLTDDRSHAVCVYQQSSSINQSIGVPFVLLRGPIGQARGLQSMYEGPMSSSPLRSPHRACSVLGCFARAQP